jgi:2-iminobutanoate/2-iminopropanoate deaminase
MTTESLGEVTVGAAPALFPAAVRFGDLLLLSGQAPLDPKTGAVVDDSFRAQARHVLSAVSATLASAGAEMHDVLRVVCILADASDFVVWNEEFAAAFGQPRPVRTTFVAGFVVPGMLLELEVTAAVPPSVVSS